MVAQNECSIENGEYVAAQNMGKRGLVEGLIVDFHSVNLLYVKIFLISSDFAFGVSAMDDIDDFVFYVIVLCTNIIENGDFNEVVMRK